MNYFLLLALVALVPLFVGFIWFGKFGFQKPWMAGTGLTHEQLRSGFNPPLVFALTYILSLFLAFALGNIVVHQAALFSILMNEPGFKNGAGGPATDMYNAFISRYGHNFRTFKHGAFHGLAFGLTVVLPIITVNGLFERKGWKFILINWGYWTFNAIIMGALLCHFAPISMLPPK